MAQTAKRRRALAQAQARTNARKQREAAADEQRRLAFAEEQLKTVQGREKALKQARIERVKARIRQAVLPDYAVIAGGALTVTGVSMLVFTMSELRLLVDPDRDEPLYGNYRHTKEY